MKERPFRDQTGFAGRANRIKEENDDLCRRIAENGFPLIKECTGY